VAAARRVLPDDATLYSLYHVDHGFAFYLGREVKLIEWSETRDELPDDVEYFCFRSHDWRFAETFSFAWEPIAFVHSQTHAGEEFPKLVVIARRLPGRNRRETRSIIREAYLDRAAGDALVR
jgi:hypothetical protein